MNYLSINLKIYIIEEKILLKKEDLAANKNQISDQFKACKDESKEKQELAQIILRMRFN